MPFEETNLPFLMKLKDAYKYASSHCSSNVVYSLAGTPRLDKDLCYAYPHVVRTAKILYDCDLTNLAAVYMMVGPPPLDEKPSGSENERIYSLIHYKKVLKDQAEIIVKLQGRGVLTDVPANADRNLRIVLLAEGAERLESILLECRTARPGETRPARVALGTRTPAVVQVPLADMLQQEIEQSNKINRLIVGTTKETKIEARYASAISEAAKQLLRLRPPPAPPKPEDAKKNDPQRAAAFSAAAAGKTQREALAALPFSVRYNNIPSRLWRAVEPKDAYTGLTPSQSKALAERSKKPKP